MSAKFLVNLIGGVHISSDFLIGLAEVKLRGAFEKITGVNVF